MERHFLLFKDQLEESGRQKTKENIIPRGKFRLVENSLQEHFPLGGISAQSDIFFCLNTNWRRVGVIIQKKISFRAQNSAWWKMAFRYDTTLLSSR